jgi:hypothetical protein
LTTLTGIREYLEYLDGERDRRNGPRREEDGQQEEDDKDAVRIHLDGRLLLFRLQHHYRESNLPDRSIFPQSTLKEKIHHFYTTTQLTPASFLLLHLLRFVGAHSLTVNSECRII